MGWPTLIIVIAAALGIPYALFVVPLGRAFLRVLAIARDPLHRATPESAWELFDRLIGLRMLPAWLGWTVMLMGACLVGPMMYAFLGPLADRYPLLFFYALLYPAHLSGTWAMAFAGMMFWAPRSGPAGLMAKVTTTVIAAQALIVLFAWVLIGRSAWPAIPGPEVAASFAIATLLAGLLAATLSWVRARRRGELWFEFDEDRLERFAHRARR
jgi:hypothetical protein